MMSELGLHASQELQSQAFLIAQAVCPALDDPDFVFHAFHETKRDLVLWLAICSDSIPMPINHFSKPLVGLQALPLQAGAPVLEETPRQGLASVVQQLTKTIP